MGLAALDSGSVIIIVTLLVLPIAAIAFAGAGKALKQIGKGQFQLDREWPEERRAPPKPVPREVREEEIRQMLQAKSDRRQMRGEAPLDVEAELSGILEAERAEVLRDRELREEVRQLVVARNERRARRGEPPLDVEEEVERQLRDLA